MKFNSTYCTTLSMCELKFQTKDGVGAELTYVRNCKNKLTFKATDVMRASSSYSCFSSIASVSPATYRWIILIIKMEF